MKVTAASALRRVGRFNFLNEAEESAAISVSFTIDGIRHVVEDTVPVGSEWDCADEDITETIDAIERSYGRYLVSTSREKARETIALFRANETSIRAAYARSMASKYQRLAAHHHRLAAAYLNDALAA